MISRPSASLYFAIESAFEHDNSTELKKLAETYSQDQVLCGQMFSFFVRASKNLKQLDYLLSNFIVSPEARTAIPLAAVNAQNLVILEALLEKYKIYPENLLCYAFAQKKDKAIEYIVENAEDFYVKNAKDCYELVVAAETSGYRKFAHKFSKIFEDTNQNIFIRSSDRHDHWERLWEAGIKAQDMDFLDLILKNGGNVNELLFGEKNLTPIQLAADERSLDLLKYFISKGADLNHTSEKHSEYGYFSPLSAIVASSSSYEGNLDLEFLYYASNLLVQNGADPSLKTEEIQSLIESAIKRHYEEDDWPTNMANMIDYAQTIFRSAINGEQNQVLKISLPFDSKSLDISFSAESRFKEKRVLNESKAGDVIIDV